MKKLLFFFSVMALAHSAFAADEAEIKTHAELRTRYWNMMMPNGNESPAGFNGSNQTFQQRNLLGITMRKGEKVGAQLTLINNFNFGNDIRNGTDNTMNTSTGAYSNDGIGTNENMLMVNEAWGWWKASDSVTLRFGRGGFTMADGSVISRFDWSKNPYSFDGAMLGWDLESVALGFSAVRIADLATGTGAGKTEINDPQVNAFTISADAKNLPEWLSVAHLDLMQINTDQSTNAALAGLGKNEQRVDVALKGAAGSIDYRLDGGIETGNLINNGADTSKLSLSANMIDAMVGWSMPDMMKFHIYANYHTDTGDSDVQDSAGPSFVGADNKWNHYDSFFYDEHNFGGMMDILAWGNLTYIQGGVSVTPADGTDVGLKYTQFTRTSTKDNVVEAGMNGSGLITGLVPGDTTSSDLGSEIDVYADHNFDNGFSGLLIAGWYAPGTYFKNGTNTAGGTGTISKTITQVMLQGKMTF